MEGCILEGKTAWVAPRHSKEVSDTDAAVKGCLRRSLWKKSRFSWGSRVSAVALCAAVASHHCEFIYASGLLQHIQYKPHAVVITEVSLNVHYRWASLWFWSLPSYPFLIINLCLGAVSGTRCSLHTLKPTLKCSWRVLNERWQHEGRKKSDCRLKAFKPSDSHTSETLENKGLSFNRSVVFFICGRK